MRARECQHDKHSQTVGINNHAAHSCSHSMVVKTEYDAREPLLTANQRATVVSTNTSAAGFAAQLATWLPASTADHFPHSNWGSA